MLFVCGGFFDGYKPVVEPLSQPVFMFADHTRTRQGEVARLLGHWSGEYHFCDGEGTMRMCFDLCHSHNVACRLVTEPCGTSFAPSTPRIYKSCTLFDPEGEERTLTFVSRPNNAYQRLFLATLSSPSIPDLQVLVKLVPRSYSRDVHKHMADNGDRKSTRLNSSHLRQSRMPSSA